MSTTWIMIANSSKAHLYKTHRAKLFKANGHDDGSLKLLKMFQHEDSRKKVSDLVTDKLGDFRSRGGDGHGSFIEPTNPKDHEAECFAKYLTEILDGARKAGEFDDVVLVATPHFQGLLQRNLSHSLSKLVSNTIEKDYTSFKNRELVNQLKNEL